MIFSSTFGDTIRNIVGSYMFFSPGPISVYSGVQPDPDTFEGSWSSYNSSNSNFLGHFTKASILGNITQANVGGSTTFGTLTPSANITPVHNGIASWAVIWDNSVNAAPASGTIPTTNYMIIDAGHITSNATIRFTNTTFSTSTPVRFESIGFDIGQG